MDAEGAADELVLSVGDAGVLSDGEGEGEPDGEVDVGGGGGGLPPVLWIGPGVGVGWVFGGFCFLPDGVGVGVQSSLGVLVGDLEGLADLVGLGAVVGESRTLGSLGLVITTAGLSLAPVGVVTVPLLATANAVPTPPAATIAVRPVSASTRRVPRLPTSVSTKS